MLAEELIEGAPTGPGVYLLFDADGRLRYVGKAVNLRRRLGEHVRANRRGFRTVTSVRWEETPDERTAVVREADLIVLVRPRLNRAHKAQSKHCYVRVDDDAISLVDAPSGYGTFPHVAKGTFSQASAMTKLGFVSLLRLLWVVQPDRATAARIPGRIAGPSAPQRHATPIPADLREPLHDFLSGIDLGLVPALHARVLESDDLPDVMHLPLARDATAACAFYDVAPRRLHDARVRFGLPAGPVDGAALGRLLAEELGLVRR